MSSQVNSRLSKTLGALLGVHAGDSLGATLEFRSWETIKVAYPNGLRDIIGGGAFSWPAGHATDDTDLTRAVLLAYRDLHTLKREAKEDEADLDVVKAAADYSLKWLVGDWPGRKLGTQPQDVGNATLTGLENYRYSKDPTTCGAGQGSAGNGSLMRCIPTGLFTRTTEERQRQSMGISAFTHNDARCTVSCAAYNEMVAALVEGRTVQEAVHAGKRVADDLDCPAVKAAIDRGQGMSIAGLANNGPGKELPDHTSGYVLQSLTVAVAALFDSRSFEEVLVDVVRIGADTDTNGAISGGLLGARDGVDAIPKRWLDKLQFRKEFEEIAIDILKIEGLA
jgi:ADP-ribosylglycohydrolase